jgi:5-hydroxyisourate hydrolase
MSTLSTHVLDTAKGRPAEGLAIVLEVQEQDAFRELARGTTNADGRVKDFVQGQVLPPGVYRLHFDTGAYFAAQGTKGFYPEVTVLFELGAESHYHVPLLLSPFGFSTYRGS